ITRDAYVDRELRDAGVELCAVVVGVIVGELRDVLSGITVDERMARVLAKISGAGDSGDSDDSDDSDGDDDDERDPFDLDEAAELEWYDVLDHDAVQAFAEPHEDAPKEKALAWVDEKTSLLEGMSAREAAPTKDPALRLRVQFLFDAMAELGSMHVDFDAMAK